MNVLLITKNAAMEDDHFYVRAKVKAISYRQATTGISFDLIIVDEKPSDKDDLIWLGSSVRSWMKKDCLLLTEDQRVWNALKGG